MSFNKNIRPLFFYFFFFFPSCISTRIEDYPATHFIQTGQWEEALIHLKKKMSHLDSGHPDLLLYFLDLGMIQHALGAYQESIISLQKANLLIEKQKTTFLREEGQAFLLSENTKEYHPKYFESLLLTSYVALNYALLQDTENALVEIRRLEKKIKYGPHITFLWPHYLSALLYEDEGPFFFDSFYEASLDYKKALSHSYSPDIQLFIQKDIDRCLSQKRKTQSLKNKHQNSSLFFGEFIFIGERGLLPPQKPDPSFPFLPSLPQWKKKSTAKYWGNIWIDDKWVGKTQLLESLFDVAQVAVTEKAQRLYRKKIAKQLTKSGIALFLAQLEQNPYLGFLLAVLFETIDQPDLRSWQFLPQDLYIFRMSLNPGTHSLRIKSDSLTAIFETSFVIQENKKTFLKSWILQE